MIDIQEQTKEIRTLAVTFDTQLKPWEIQWFRGAMAHKVGLEHEWFHNHNNATGGYHHRYPLIQYKLDTHDGNMRPMLLCLEHGVEEAHHYFAQPDWSLQIAGQRHAMRIHKLRVQKHRLGVFEQGFTYRIHKWQPLNTDNYAEYKAITSLAKRITFLENLLASHLLAFAKGVDYHIPTRFELSIREIFKEEWISYKGIKVLAFSLDFDCDLSLPEWLGVGKGSSIGFGMIRTQNWAKFEQNEFYEEANISL